MADDTAPQPQAPQLPNRKRGPARSLWLFLLLAALLVWIGPLRTEVEFRNDAGRIPAPFEVTLRSGKKTKKVMVEDGNLRFLRPRWHELDVTDTGYIRSIHRVKDGKMKIVIERNALLRLRDAAAGQPSVPQRGDPDPAADR